MITPFDGRPAQGINAASGYLTSIPALLQTHGSIAATCRVTGLNEITLSKYQFDFKCERHIIVAGRLMTHKNTSPVIYSRTGLTRNDRLKQEG